MDAVNVVRQLSLIKGDHRYVFRYAPGHEPEVLDAFAAMAVARDRSFDWFDAAVMSYQMGRHLETELDNLRTEV